jgi:hypothetical protein
MADAMAVARIATIPEIWKFRELVDGIHLFSHLEKRVDLVRDKWMSAVCHPLPTPWREGTDHAPTAPEYTGPAEGPLGKILTSQSLMDVFLHFFPISLIDHIVTCSNAHAQQEVVAEGKARRLKVPTSFSTQPRRARSNRFE